MKKVVWVNEESAGSEYIEVVKTHHGIEANGNIILTTEKDAFKIDYHMLLDSDWKVKRLEVNQGKASSFTLHSNGKGTWCSSLREEWDTEGIIDLDLSITPFSNSLPINRFKWKPHHSRRLHVLFIDGLSLDIRVREQVYTYLGRNEFGRQFNYRCEDYETVLTVDEDGFVTDYPGVFSCGYKEGFSF
ncbi:hypothetical protein EQV77_04470 [Halobacillus fulvus]|nr:hypothetical protein EQV77_04470 [Halobacillus fulvus]